ncbi:MAG: MATE family efflux transporter [Lachnospiraceae bacterium]|nr:MATE family efflux transporter [Lachnospiraceae bacterium]
MRIKESLKSLNWGMFRALLVMGLCPVIYTTVRVFFLGQLPGDYAFSIAGQLSWVSLLYEVLDEAIILPLFYFLGRAFKDKAEMSNRIRTGLILSLIIYSVIAVIIMIFITPLLQFMAATPDIIPESATYIRIESVANVFGILFRFAQVALIVIGSEKLVYGLTAVKVLLSLVLDTFLVSQLSMSLALGVNGIGISNIISNVILFLVTLVMIERCGYSIRGGGKLSFAWIKDFLRVGGISGLESLVRNIAYMLMVSRMVNMVGEQGTYWVANNFIWGWLLLPILQLGELIKQEVAKDKAAVKNNTPAYFVVTTATCLLWVILIPLFKPFMQYVLGFEDVDKLFSLVMTLLIFYVMYAFQNIFDMTFYGAGKTEYMLAESVITNAVYYGGFFIAYLTGAWVPSLLGIALMFGGGNAFDTVVSGVMYWRFRRKMD